MDSSSGHSVIEDISARPFLRLFALVVLTVTVLVATFNRLSHVVILRPENQAIVQLIGGWSRVYKPILMDHFRPEVAVYGASWARDAFDPLTVAPATGRSWFNHAVSGATPYETRRFIESSLDDPNLRAVIVNLDTFLVPEAAVRRKQGFDESLLDQDASGQPTRWLTARRELALTFSGAALGNNVEVLSAIRARASGAEVESYLESYDRFDFRGHEAGLARLRAGLESLAVDGAMAPVAANEDLPSPPGAGDLERALRELCQLDIDIYGYFTPSMVLLGPTERSLATQLYGLRLLRRLQPDCQARLHFYNFNYPNAITLDGLEPTGRYSEYFRTDGHPRPTIGLLMAARMFGQPLPAGTPAAIAADFGVELLGDPDGEARLREQWRRLAALHRAVGG